MSLISKTSTSSSKLSNYLLINIALHIKNVKTFRMFILTSRRMADIIRSLKINTINLNSLKHCDFELFKNIETLRYTILNYNLLKTIDLPVLFPNLKIFNMIFDYETFKNNLNYFDVISSSEEDKLINFDTVTRINIQSNELDSHVCDDVKKIISKYHNCIIHFYMSNEDKVDKIVKELKLDKKDSDMKGKIIIHYNDNYKRSDRYSYDRYFDYLINEYVKFEIYNIEYVDDETIDEIIESEAEHVLISVNNSIGESKQIDLTKLKVKSLLIDAKDINLEVIVPENITTFCIRANYHTKIMHVQNSANVLGLPITIKNLIIDTPIIQANKIDISKLNLVNLYVNKYLYTINIKLPKHIRSLKLWQILADDTKF